MKKLNTFGEHLRQLREASGHTLKNVAENIEMDISLLAKIERNERLPNRMLIKKIACFFEIDEKSLTDEFLSDQIAYKILDENADLNVLKVAEEKIKYFNNRENGK